MRRTLERTNRTILLLLVAALAAACGASLSAPTADSPTPTATAAPLSGEAVIYVTAPLSGPGAEEGQAQAAGARLAADVLNEQGGLGGQEIIVRTLNDRGTLEGAQQAAETIATSGDTIYGVVTSEGSDPTLQAVQDTYLGGALSPAPLVVVPASTHPDAVTPDDPRFFRLSAPNQAQAAEIAAVMREGNLSDAITVQSPTERADMLTAQFEQAADEYGVSLLDTVSVTPTGTNFADVAADIFAQNPAGLFLATDAFETAQLLTALYAIDYQGAIYAADYAMPYSVVDELGCQAEGLYRASVVPGASTVMTANQQQRYAANEGRVPEPFSVAGYAAVEFIVRAYNDAETTDAATAAEYARSTPVSTLMGEMQFDDSGNRQDPALHFQQVQARLFRDAFARTAGEPPQVSEQGGDANETYLARSFAEGVEPVVFADLNWNSALFHNAIARYIIESGYDTPTHAVPGSTVPSFQRLVRGDVDVILERYNFDDTVAEAIASGQIADLGVNFTDAVQGWFVPRYVVEGDNAAAPELQSVEQLDGYTDLFAAEGQSGVGAFYGGVPGWTAHKINCQKLKAYRLDDDYAQVTSDSTAELFGALDTAYSAGDPILIYLWTPTWPLASYDLMQLDEPAYDPECWQENRGCAYPTSDVRVLVAGDLPERAPEVSDFLENIEMDIDDVTQMLLRIENGEFTPDEAAIHWLQENEDVWSSWLPGEVAESVRVDG